MQGDVCENPNCSDRAEKHYTGPNGNKLHLCERHYYNLVSGKSKGVSNVTISPGVEQYTGGMVGGQEMGLGEGTITATARKPWEQSEPLMEWENE